jgi:ABC-type thiamin/hydroxymethylpyrimidine transport system permease subunit
VSILKWYDLRFETMEIAIIVVFSAFGAVMSVPVGYLGNYLKTFPAIPLGAGQILSGVHVFPVALAMMLVRRRGAAAATATVKGLVEAVLFSFHGFSVIMMSGVQGLVLDAAGAVFGYDSRTGLCIGCGLSAASNVAYLQFFMRLGFPLEVFALMYVLAFVSGAVFGGYLGDAVHRMVQKRIEL